VTPGRTSGDISYWFIDNVTANEFFHLNLLNSNFSENAEVICWKGGENGIHLDEEQWYLKYAQDGYYYIISRLSNKYLYCTNTASGSEVRLKEGPAPKARSKDIYLWRLQPVDSKADTRAPAAPTELTMQQQEDGVELSWTAPTDSDPLTYIVLRADVPETEGAEMEYNTIARGITTTTYVDETAEKDKPYSYKVKAVDYAGNRSKASDELATSIEELSTVNPQPSTLNGQGFDMSGKPATADTKGVVIYPDKKILNR
jgi:hypothetical protein